jgi:hypothetical protein
MRCDSVRLNDQQRGVLRLGWRCMKETCEYNLTTTDCGNGTHMDQTSYGTSVAVKLVSSPFLTYDVTVCVPF